MAELVKYQVVELQREGG